MDKYFIFKTQNNENHKNIKYFCSYLMLFLFLDSNVINLMNFVEKVGKFQLIYRMLTSA